jgi:hypothetical protein
MAQSRKIEQAKFTVVEGEPTPLFDGGPSAVEASAPATAAQNNDAQQSAPVQAQGAQQPAETTKPSVSAGLTAAKLRIDPNVETTPVRRLLTRVPVIDRPDPQWYIRIHPKPEFRMEGLGVINFSRDRRLYAIDPQFSELLKAYYKRYYLFTGTTITRAIFLWVIPMPGEDGSWNAWPQSKYDCALVAMDRWIQVLNGGSCFEPHALPESKPDPMWDECLHPCTSLDQLLDLGFKSTYVNKQDHPVIEALLRGG